MPAVDLSAAAARARTQQPADNKPDEPEVIPADTAFLVYRNGETGQIVMTHDINAPLLVKRSPNHDDVYMMMNVILKDMAAAQTAALTVQNILAMQQQVAQQMMSPAEQAAMQAMMSGKGGFPTG